MKTRTLSTAGRAPGPIDPELILDAVPVRNQAVRSEKYGEGLLLKTPIAPRWWMGPPFSWLMAYRKERGVALDKLGAEVWEACDGDTTLETIIERFADRHRIRFHEARISVMQFLKMLVQRKVMAVVVPRAAERATEAGG